jgi:hypothetical protein
MLQIGFLLQTHNKPHQTRRLIERLLTLYDYPRIVCHHDFSQCDLDTTGYPSCVQFVRPHVSTAWGRISSVEATVAALRLLMDSAQAPDWFTILSGADYPVAASSVVRADLENSHADAFLVHFPVGIGKPKTSWERTCVLRYLHKVIHVHYLNRRLRPSWRPIRLPRWLSRPFLPFSKTFRCYAGWNWFCGNGKTARKILDFHDTQPALARHYSRLWCVDESYFQCILANDPSLRLINDNKRFTEWEEGSPHPNTLTLAHLPKILASGCHFARKFDSDTHPEVLDALDDHLNASMCWKPEAQAREFLASASGSL